ncbi:MAG: hypothetical protein SCM11_05000 [Bacillota bacterium]|nr:hypothetical protein [Bacillota bacterium]
MTEDERTMIRASAEIVRGIISNSSVSVMFQEDETGRITIWYHAAGSDKPVNIATFFDSVYRGIKAVPLD